MDSNPGRRLPSAGLEQRPDGGRGVEFGQVGVQRLAQGVGLPAAAADSVAPGQRIGLEVEEFFAALRPEWNIAPLAVGDQGDGGGGVMRQS